MRRSPTMYEPRRCRFPGCCSAVSIAMDQCRPIQGGAIQSDAVTLRTFAIRLVSITAASLRFPSELATVMTVDAKRHANFRGRLKNFQLHPDAECRRCHLPTL